MRDFSLKINPKKVSSIKVVGIYKKMNQEKTAYETDFKLITTIINEQTIFALIDSTRRVKIVSTGAKQILDLMTETGYKPDRKAWIQYQEQQYRKTHRIHPDDKPKINKIIRSDKKR